MQGTQQTQHAFEEMDVQDDLDDINLDQLVSSWQTRRAQLLAYLYQRCLETCGQQNHFKAVEQNILSEGHKRRSCGPTSLSMTE